MLSSLVLQLLIDVMLVGVIVWLWLQQKKVLPSLSAQSASKVGVEDLERLTELESKFQEFKSLMEDEIKKMRGLHDRIQKLVEQGALTAGIFPCSQEEQELKEMVQKKSPEQEIPSLQELQTTKQRFKDESHFDLRTLLRDQLA